MRTALTLGMANENHDNLIIEYKYSNLQRKIMSGEMPQNNTTGY